MDTKKLETILEEGGIVFLTYGGFITQSLIAGMTEALEKESEQNELSQKVANNIFTIFIELSQNMMNYSKSKKEEDKNFDPKGLIMVGKNDKNHYYILSQNILNSTDKEKILPKLVEISTLDQDGIKARYRELRRSGHDQHGKGAGIGFYEIAKRCDDVKYEFERINDDKYYFKFKAIIKS